jgi:hypothetical protein
MCVLLLIFKDVVSVECLYRQIMAFEDDDERCVDLKEFSCSLFKGPGSHSLAVAGGGGGLRKHQGS